MFCGFLFEFISFFFFFFTFLTVKTVLKWDYWIWKDDHNLFVFCHSSFITYIIKLFFEQTTEREFALQEASFKKIHDLGNSLLQRADSSSAENIRVIIEH